MSARGHWLGAATLAGLVAVFVGERLVTGPSARIVLDVAGVLGVSAAALLRWSRTATPGAPARARIERTFALLSTAAVVALLAWFAQSDAVPALGGPDVLRAAPRLATALQLLAALLGVGAAVPLVLGALAEAGMDGAPEPEVARVHDAVGSGLALVAVLAAALALGWVADARDVVVDGSRPGAGRPGAATLAAVRGLAEPVTFTLFYPPGSDVGERVRAYVEALASASPLVRIERLDAAVDLARARALGVTRNGAVVVGRGPRHETWTSGVDADAGRTPLRDLDSELQRRLLAVVRPRKVLYLTTGHGERAATNADPADARGTVRLLEDLLRAQNDEVRPLGASEGLAVEVPRDASAVLVLGPTRPFLREEVESLVRWLRGGGRLLVALDPEGGDRFDALLQPLGLRFVPTRLVNDRVYLARAHQPSDRAQLVTASFGAHPSVAELARSGGREALFLLGAGSLELLPQRPADLSVDFTVLALPETFRDADGDFAFDSRLEKRRAWELAAAVVLPRRGDATPAGASRSDAGPARPEPGEAGRGVVVADSDVFTDLVLDASLGNRTFSLDAVRWLLGEDAAGLPERATDVPLQHTRAQDVAWFYATVFVAPASVVALGVWRTRRRSAGPRSVGR